MKTPISIRSAEPRDREVLIVLMRRASLANPGDREALLAHPEAIDVPVEQLTSDMTCIAELAGVPAGFATVLPRPDGEAELDGLFVEPHLWRSGVGRALVARAIELARGGDARFLHVVANPHAFDFYRAVGFVDFGIAETQFGSGALMRIPL
ncbi:MAG: GNAT family N-acetyltransferase [Devosia sp.]